MATRARTIMTSSLNEEGGQKNKKGVAGNCLLGLLGLSWHFGGGKVLVLVTPPGGPLLQRVHFMLIAPDGLVYDFVRVQDEHRQGWDCGILFEGWVRVRTKGWWAKKYPQLIPEGE